MKNLNYIKFLSLLFIVQILGAYQPTGKMWLSYNMPVSYEINQNGTPDCDGEFGAIHQAFETWENVSTSWIRFNDAPNTSRMPDTNDGYNTIAWIESGWTSLPRNPPIDEIALVYVQDTDLNGRPDECDQYFNGEYWSWSTTEQSNRFDVENVAAHEAGHWIGLASLGSAYSETTMYDVLNYQETKKRDLHSDDIAGASFLYPYQVDWPPALEGVYYDPYHHFNVDVAAAWDPTGKDEYFHLACLEGEEFAGSYDTLDTLLPFETVVTPVRVVYVNNGIMGWEKDILSDWHTAIRGPQLEIDGQDNVHIIWTECNQSGPNKVIYSKRDAQSGTWGWPEVLSDDAASKRPSIAVSHASTQSGDPHYNRVYAAWVKWNVNQTEQILKFTRSSDGGTNWESSQQIAQADYIVNPQLAIDSSSGVHIVWWEETKGNSYDSLCWMKNNLWGANWDWGNKVAKERLTKEYGPSVAIDGYGYIHIAYAIVYSDRERRVHYDRISNLGQGSWVWDSVGPISPANRRASNPHVVCDNLGFVHLFWDDNRNYTSSSLMRDVFHSRNFHMGDDLHWEQPKDGSKIYIFSPHNSPYIYLSDVAQPDTFGDLFVGVDVKWPNYSTNWDVYATLGRQDDLVRNFPWPPQQSAPFAAAEEASLDIEPQGCYLSASLNRLFYFAPAEAQLSCYSVDGRRVHEQKLKGAGQLEFNFLPSGTYFAHLKSTDGSSSRTKIVVIH